jgi:hypothetical protein
MNTGAEDRAAGQRGIVECGVRMRSVVVAS